MIEIIKILENINLTISKIIIIAQFDIKNIKMAFSYHLMIIKYLYKCKMT